MSDAAEAMVTRRQLVRTLVWSAASVLVVRPRRSSASEIAPAGMRAAANYSAACTGVAMLVMQGGRVTFEDYRDGHAANGRRKIYSGTKGFWVLAALKAAEEGILDLDERVSTTIPDWQGNEKRAGVTLRQLLNFSSGLDAANHLHGDNFRDRNVVALRTPLVASPGASFIYGPAALQVFHEVFKRKLAVRGDKPTKYLERKVLRPMGLGPQRYLEDQQGNPLLATGFMMTTRQWSRMGELILNHGSPVLSARSLAMCLHGTSANCAFGMGFWNNAMASERARRELDIEDNLEGKWHRQNWSAACICSDAPADLVAAVGSGYQRLFVIPSMKLVVVRQGKFGRMSDAKFLRLLLGQA
jgi:CubicO group peptidase (beta-lactamase class C family)